MTSYQKHQRKVHFLWLAAISMRLTPQTHNTMLSYFTHFDALKEMNNQN